MAGLDAHFAIIGRVRAVRGDGLSDARSYLAISYRCGKRRRERVSNSLEALRFGRHELFSFRKAYRESSSCNIGFIARMNICTARGFGTKQVWPFLGSLAD